MRKSLMALMSLTMVACGHLSQTSTPLPEGITLVESHRVAQGEVGIAYDKYELDNGLTLVLHHDHSDPLVHVDMTYHVGSAREEQGYSGFAHFFEHMMFQGSENVGDQEHFRLITEAGGTLNGTTNRDRTNYFQTVPANELEKILWLEADRMGFLLDAVSQHKFEIQRDTVKNERAQMYENRPYGLMYERMGEALFPREHPYSWQTIGYIEDLNRVDVDDLKAFFLRWYGPNNAVLTVGGDIDTQTTLEWVKKYFGSIPRGPEVDAADKWPVTLDNDRFITLEDQIQQPMLMMAWPTEYLGSENEFALDVLARVLGSGRNSLLYQELVKTGKVLDAGAFHDCAELACTFYVYAMGNSGDAGDLTVIREQVLEVLGLLRERGVNEQDIEEVIGMVEAGTIFGLQSVRGKVTQLASNETFFGKPDRLAIEKDKLYQVKPKDVEAAFAQFVDGRYSVSLSTIPAGQHHLAAREVNYTPAERQLPEHVTPELVYRRAEDSFDRSLMPQPTAPSEVTLPDLYRFELENGIDVLGTVNSETPTVQLRISLPAGRRDETVASSGIARLTAAMMNEGSTKRSAEELQTALDKIGSSVSFNANTYTTTLSITTLVKHLDETLEIAAEKLWHPAFDETDFQRLRKQALEGLRYEQQRPAWLASEATRKLMFEGTPFALSGDGTVASLNQLTLDDVKQFYADHYTHNEVKVVIVGDVEEASIKQSLETFGKWQGGVKPARVSFELPQREGGAIWLVNRPHSPQSVIRLVRPALPYDGAGEMYQTQLANFNLGGNFNSRINQNLREDKGYTYGAGGYLVNGREIGYMTYYGQVRADVTGAALREFINEMNEATLSGFTDAEMDYMRLAVGQKEALSYETPSQKAGLLAQMQIYDMDETFVAEQNQVVAEVDKATLNALAEKWFDPSHYHMIVVGDAALIRAQLEELELPIFDLNIDI
ncbi:M16 family metallopeptidase [Thaumasiovibrio subtropicus]|uniref:M16 family metallopeptidase n=1 Tax=Thaumasiovibrio subtropicus TaxID=1891207 RepID=UPI000B362BA3|nr:pitrilysin family protein [Thaumasiovibrio subtropicus]